LPKSIFIILKNNFMGKISKGILGGFAGTVGTVIGGNWKGIDYMRSKPAVRSGEPTPAQAAHRQRFTVVGAFIKAINEVLSIAYREYPSKMSANNHVFAHVAKNAIIGQYPNLGIDYAKVILASGKLLNAVNPTAAAGAAGEVRFEWTNNADSGIAKAGDRAMLIVYCEELKQCAFDVSGANRSQSNGVAAVAAFSGKTVHTWLTFISETGKDAATSVYTGSVLVS
jgi:hypothetical protein